VNPTQWPDYNLAFADTAPTAYAVVRDAPIQSIGELGYIYDPQRVIATSGGLEILRRRFCRHEEAVAP
jgi:hypothetical protein